LDGVRRPQAEAALRSPDHRAHRGLLWGAWHFPLFSSGDLSGALPLALFLPVQLFSFLAAYRVLMVWVYDRTGSLLVAMLMHASLTASTLILQPLDVAGMRALTYDLVLAAALWLLIAALAMANGRQLSRPLLRPRVA
jgi:CAAX protease family protein